MACQHIKLFRPQIITSFLDFTKIICSIFWNHNRENEVSATVILKMSKACILFNLRTNIFDIELMNQEVRSSKKQITDYIKTFQKKQITDYIKSCRICQ